MGTALGIIGSLGVSRFLNAMLYRIQPTDVSTLLGVSAMLLIVAALATALPARAGTRVDPVRALRAEV